MAELNMLEKKIDAYNTRLADIQNKQGTPTKANGEPFTDAERKNRYDIQTQDRWGKTFSIGKLGQAVKDIDAAHNKKLGIKSTDTSILNYTDVLFVDNEATTAKRIK